MPIPLPRPGPTDELDDPGYELDLVLDQYADEIEAAHAALPGKLGATPAEIGAAIAGAADKGTPADADSVAIEDAGTLKRISWANLKVALGALYARLAGVSGGQTLIGGTGTGENLTLRSTSHATRGKLLFGTSAYDEATNRLGIGISSPTAALHLKAGTTAAGTAPLKLVSGSLLTTPEAGAIEQSGGVMYHTSDSAARRAIASEPFAAQFGLGNIMPNGSAHIKENRNFSTYTYDAADRPAGYAGSFRINVASGTRRSDDLIQVDASRRLHVSVLVKAGDIGGGNFNAGNRQYFGIEFYDVDGLAIGSENSYSYAGSTDTTLAAQLNPGDTTVSLTSAAGWYNAGSTTSSRLTWYGYADSTGYVYPDYTYSRNVSPSGSWGSGGITGNTITLSSPWSGPALPAGSAVSNRPSGAVFNYFASNVTVPNTWTQYEWTLDGFGANAYNYRHGTVYVKFGHLVNYHGSADTNVRLAAVRFSPISAANLESSIGVGASYKTLRPAALPTNGLAVEGKVGSGTSSPSAQGHFVATSEQLRLGYDAANYQSFTVDASGIMTLSGPLVLSPAASATPTVNNKLTIERTSNTQLTFRLKGSDGTVRSASLTLS